MALGALVRGQRGIQGLTGPPGFVLATNPTIYNITVATANLETALVLNADVKAFIIRVRGYSNLQLAFTSGESGTNFITVPAGCSYREDLVSYTGSLFFQTNKPNQSVEVLEWV